MVMPADVFSGRTQSKILTDKDIEQDNEERSFFMPKGMYKEPVEAYFKTVEGERPVYYSGDGYYYKQEKTKV